MEIQYYNDPFKHVIIDNFFDKDTLDFIQSKIDYKIENTDIYNILNTNRARQRLSMKQLYDYNIDIDEPLSKYFKLIDTLDIKQDKEKTYTSQYAYFPRAKPEVEDYPVHTENIYKAVSVVVYLNKDHNNGTELYDNKKQFVKEIEHKYNRAFVMSGFNNQNGKLPGNSTWHTYRTKPGTIRKTLFGYTVSSMESVKNHSLYELYYKNGMNGDNRIKKRFTPNNIT
jgi:hypothetical protein